MFTCVQLLMNVPFTAVHFAAYETAKRVLATEDDENLMTQLVAGGDCGGAVSLHAPIPWTLSRPGCKLTARSGSIEG